MLDAESCADPSLAYPGSYKGAVRPLPRSQRHILQTDKQPPLGAKHPGGRMQEISLGCKVYGKLFSLAWPAASIKTSRVRLGLVRIVIYWRKDITGQERK